MKRASWLWLILVALGFILCAVPSPHKKPLWPGGRFTEADRARALQHGIRFIYGTACDRRNFASYGPDYLWCFYCIASTSADPDLRRLAWAMGNERAHQWRRDNPTAPLDADSDEVADLAYGSYGADLLGVRDDPLKERIRQAAARFSAEDYLGFRPTIEPPPSDVPKRCSKCGARNPRGRDTCRKCGARLKMWNRYEVWLDALITTYSGDRYGVTLGAHYTDVIQWLPAMRPYGRRGAVTDDEFYDTVYAITHVVYTLNDYSAYRLSPRWLPQEFQFLRENLKEAIGDPETMGEFLDTLRSFGLTNADPTIRAGVDYILSTQNSDGSWGDVQAQDAYVRYHTTWTAIDGLREYAWRGEGLSFAAVKSSLEQWARAGERLDR